MVYLSFPLASASMSKGGQGGGGWGRVGRHSVLLIYVSLHVAVHNDDAETYSGPVPPQTFLQARCADVSLLHNTTAQNMHAWAFSFMLASWIDFVKFIVHACLTFNMLKGWRAAQIQLLTGEIGFCSMWLARNSVVTAKLCAASLVCKIERRPCG